MSDYSLEQDCRIIQEMWAKFHKGFSIFFIAVITGLFFQFSIDKRPVGEQEFVFKPSPPPFLTDHCSWADSIYKTLNTEEKIGQLLMVAAYPNNGKSDVHRVTELIKKHHIGGIIFFQGKPEEIARLTRYYQSVSDIPLMIAIDGEWGPSMRVENTLQYPRQMMLGAIDDNDLLYYMGRDVGRQLHLLGIHVNFAPVVDVNNNPDNPVIGSRSFGESRENVARKGIMYMRGMQDERILAVAKHFPGHGDTDKDSHQELPLISHTANRLDSIELFPFKALIESGIGGIMTAHLNVPGLDTTKNRPSTLSPLIADSLLKHKLNFKGLVFTDAMTMQGVAGLYPAKESNLLALLAGNDILLMPEDLNDFIDQLKDSVENNPELVRQISLKCNKVLEAKSWLVIPERNTPALSQRALIDSLNSPYFDLLRRRLIEEALTVVTNPYELIPVKHLENWKIASVAIGTDSSFNFQNTVSLYTRSDNYMINSSTDSLGILRIMDTLKNYNLVILSLHASDFRASKQYGVDDRLLSIADTIIYSCPTILTAFTSPYLLSKLKNLSGCQALVVAYENDNTTQDLAAQMLFGAIPAKGHLPVSINREYRSGMGVDIKDIQRLKYTIPLEAGFDVEKFKLIDSLVADGITNKAMPGCQILAAKDGKVIFYKSYGYHTYYKRDEVKNTDLYDLASVTKILATVPAIMHLEDNKMIDIHEPLSEYIPELEATNLSKIRIDDILLHQAGLPSFIPFYQSYMIPVYPGQKFSSTKYSAQYPIHLGNHTYINKHLKYTPESFSRDGEEFFTRKIADGFYMNPVLEDSIYLKIYESKLRNRGKYLYSDLGFYLFKRMVEQISQKEFDLYLDSLFYRPMGASSLGFNPLERFEKEQIAPTENDLVFRRQVVHGYVHDPGAAMLGGISGHAGLFSNANDLAKFMQMLLNKGTYGDQRYLDRGVIEYYTSCLECKNGNRRGLGFDKPEPDTSKSSPTFKDISPESYGHSGFTGTLVWADPSTGIVYIFLSNRVYPDAAVNKLAEMNIRTNIQKAIYDARIPEIKYETVSH